MRLIINTNRVIAALIKDSICRKIIMSRKFELVTPGFTVSEIKKHKPEILGKAKISDAEFNKLLSILFNKIYIADDKLIKKREKQARKIMDHIDPDDSPFISLALSVQNDGIWSDDRHFTEQDKIKVYQTAVLLRYF